jgi:hypothetical protein
MLLDDHNGSQPEPKPLDKPVDGKKVAGTLSLAGGFAILFHLIHAAGVLNDGSNTLKAIPATSFTIIDSAIPQPYNDTQRKVIEADTLTRAEAMKLINKSGG